MICANLMIVSHDESQLDSSVSRMGDWSGQVFIGSSLCSLLCSRLCKYVLLDTHHGVFRPQPFNFGCITQTTGESFSRSNLRLLCIGSRCRMAFENVLRHPCQSSGVFGNCTEILLRLTAFLNMASFYLIIIAGSR